MNVASASHFSQTYAFFPNSVLFLYVFYDYLNLTMLKIFKSSIFLCLMGFLVHFSAFAQGSRPGSETENLVLSAVTCLNSNDAAGAKAMLSKALANDPQNDAAWYYLAMASLMSDDIAEAEEYLKSAVALDPDNFWYRYRLATLYGATQRKELTIDIYEKLLEDFPKKSELYLDMVDLYAAQGEFEKALETINQVETVFGVSETLVMYRFNLLRHMERYEEAFASLEKYNEEYSSPYVLSTLGDWQMSMYNDSTALAYYNEALGLAPDYAPALLGKAETYRLTRRYDDYFNVLNAFVSFKDIPAAAKTEYLMAVVQRTDPKFIRTFMPQLDSVIAKTVGVHPQDSTALETAGIYFYSTDRNEEAKKYFGKNVELRPESFSATANYVEFLMYAEEWETLAVEGRKAFERFPKETAFLEMASMGDYSLERYEDVLQICEKVLEVAPKDSSSTLRAWSTMGDIYHLLGDPKKSYKAYDKALKVNPDYVYVLNNYAYYLSMEGRNLKKAYAMSKKAIEAEPDNATYLDTFGWILYLQGKPDQAKPYFKQAMLYGGKDSPVILDHYAEVLYALKDYDMAFVYWNLARQKNNEEIPDLEERIDARKKAVNR